MFRDLLNDVAKSFQLPTPAVALTTARNKKKTKSFLHPQSHIERELSCVMLYVESKQQKLINVININQFIMNSEISHEYESNLL